jgi:hypothetical protein
MKPSRNCGGGIWPREDCVRNVKHMAGRAMDGGAKSRAWRMSAVAVVALGTFTCGLTGAVAHADEPAAGDATVPESTVPTAEFNGAEVAVDVPPVPPTPVDDAVEVAVDVPPVPPTPLDDAVEVAVDVPPVPPVTIADAAPIGESAIVASEVPVPASDGGPQLPETGAGAARATAIVAGAAVSIGAALKALANRA